MPQPLDSKGESLRQQGVLNPHPQKVADPLFLRGEFFDPRDLVQVKYEMLRRVRVEGASVTEVVSGVRVLPSRLLSGPGALPPRRLAGLDPSTTRTPDTPTSSPTSSSISCSNTSSATRCSEPPRSRSWFESSSTWWSILAASNAPWSADEKKSHDPRRSSGPGPRPAR